LSTAGDTGFSPGAVGASVPASASGIGAKTSDERPEIAAAGAFAGGVALALFIRWLGRDREDG
jgi:hypothetical protein